MVLKLDLKFDSHFRVGSKMTDFEKLPKFLKMRSRRSLNDMMF